MDACLCGVHMKKLPLILLIIGVLIISIPVAGQLYSKYQEDRMMKAWLNSAETDDSEDTADLDPEAAFSMLQEAFSSEAVESQTGDPADETGDMADDLENDGSGAAEDALANTDGQTGNTAGSGGSGSSAAAKPKEQKVLGVIQIKKIKLKEPIVEGVGKDNLYAGIGHIPGTAGLGEPGNCALAGHRNYAFKKFFRRLDELDIGDEVIISTKDEDLTYTVTGKSVVEPDDVSVLGGRLDENILTLITCTPVYVASHRLIVTAELTAREARVS